VLVFVGIYYIGRLLKIQQRRTLWL